MLAAPPQSLVALHHHYNNSKMHAFPSFWNLIDTAVIDVIQRYSKVIEMCSFSFQFVPFAICLPLLCCSETYLIYKTRKGITVKRADHKVHWLVLRSWTLHPNTNAERIKGERESLRFIGVRACFMQVNKCFRRTRFFLPCCSIYMSICQKYQHIFFAKSVVQIYQDQIAFFKTILKSKS